MPPGRVERTGSDHRDRRLRELELVQLHAATASTRSGTRRHSALRGAPEKMAQGYKSYYDEMIAAALADASGPRKVQPPRI